MTGISQPTAETVDHRTLGPEIHVVCPSCGRRSMGSFRIDNRYNAIVPTTKGERAASFEWGKTETRIRFTCQRATCGRTVVRRANTFADAMRRATGAGVRNVEV